MTTTKRLIPVLLLFCGCEEEKRTSAATPSATQQREAEPPIPVVLRHLIPEKIGVFTLGVVTEDLPLRTVGDMKKGIATRVQAGYWFAKDFEPKGRNGKPFDLGFFLQPSVYAEPEKCHAHLSIYDKPSEMIIGSTDEGPTPFKHPLIRKHESDVTILPRKWRRPKGDTYPMPSALAEWNNDSHKFELRFREEWRDLKDVEKYLLEAAADGADWADRFLKPETTPPPAELRSHDKALLARKWRN